MCTEERTQGGGSRGGGSLLLQNVLLEKSKLGSVVVKGMMVDRGGGFARAAAAWGDLASSEGVQTSSLENSSLTSSLLPLSHGNSSSSSSSSSSFTGSASITGSGRESGDKDYSSGGGNHHKLSSVSRASNGSDSSESSCSTLGYGGSKPHKANDKRWEGIQAIRVRDGSLGLSHFKLLKRLGCGDIGSVYLAELRGSHSHFAMKVMDKDSLARRKKLLRAQTEREILQSLDHPFLPTLYTHFESDKFLCLVMEFCSGGDLHTLRQRQPGKHFSEQAARFYAAEILLALEYLHMMGVVYRDLKPENVLVREDGHIMLSDFDLSLKCAVSPTLVKSSAADSHDGGRRAGIPVYCIQPVSCAEPSCVVPSCVGPVGALSCVSPCFVMKSSLPSLLPSFVRKKKDAKNAKAGGTVTPLPELFAEPTDARSMSFVGTHEYLAPEIIKGDGHGSAVDWWTFGIFLYELLFGKTPFKGSGNRATLFNVVGQPLKFPESATGQVSFAARDLIRGLLVKEPLNRLASKRGAAEIKAHPFFEGVNWALIRCTSPPEVPRPFELGMPGSSNNTRAAPTESSHSSGGSYVDFDFF
ncbi:unnamed protein product [Sphagnum troendelagicum]|uniref:non-specific serine/threonine protein kinase n=1 Tax=Sphagnum troendelagicum TaxID=128251 RepID=A0ABP0T7B4_9BRYO